MVRSLDLINQHSTNNLIQGSLNSIDHLLTLDYTIQNKKWHLTSLSFQLPKNLQSIITYTIIPSTPYTIIQKDSIFWTLSANGTLTTMSCYNALNIKVVNTNINLNWLWQIQVPKKLYILCGYVRMTKSKVYIFLIVEECKYLNTVITT